MPRNKLPAVVILGLTILCAPTGADTLTATRGQPLREVSHAVDLRVQGGVATYTVRRSFANTGKRHEEASLRLDLPAGAAATGLRIRAGRRWHRGELMTAERAAALYTKLTGIGPHEPRDPAILLWLGESEARLRVFPVPPGRTATVEYTLTAPTSYAGGRHGVEYVAPGRHRNLAPPVVRVFPQTPRAVITLDGKLVAAAQPVTIPRKNGAAAGVSSVQLQLTPPPMRTMAARLGRVVAGKGRQFCRLEVDVAPRLGEVPQKPAVVFVVDASHSVGPRGVEAQLALMRAFWSHVPDARVEVVLYRRRAARLLGGFVGLAEAARRLAAAGVAGRLKPGNGSNLDRALTLAVAALRGAVRRRGRGYLVTLGDGRMRLSFRNRPSLRALARAPRGVVTHVALTSPGRGPDEHRDDSHDLAPLAAARGGVLLQVTGVSAAAHDAEALRRVALGLVRPVRIDSFRIAGLPGEGFAEVPSLLEEGSGLRKMTLLSAAPRRLVLTGKVWARSVKRVVRASGAFSRATAAWVFSTGQYVEISRAEMLRVARFGRAVSPVTSYLAIEPGVRPSTEGLLFADSALGESHGIGGLGLVGTGRGGGGVYNNMADEVRATVRRCVKRLRPPGGWSATLSVETTLHEIVDVSLRSSMPALDRCIVEGTWRLRLPKTFHQAHQVYKVSLPL